MCKFFRLLFIFFIILTLIMPLSFATDAAYVWSSSVETSNNTTKDTPSTSASLNLDCGSAILIEQNSGKILYEQNAHEKFRPASVTKIMTILLIMEALDSGKISLTDKVPCSTTASQMGGSQIWLDETEELTVDEMLKAICVVSANDCTVAMAEFLCGSEELFVQEMNKKANELGMKNTTFKNCHGIDEDGHVTSAYDIALMSRELMNKHSSITKYTTIWMDSLRDGKSELVNTNKLVRNYSGCTGLKTGSTSLALFNLSATATKKDLSLIAVIMKAPTSTIRFNEAKKLLDYGFNNYNYKEFAKEGNTVENIPVFKGIQKNLELIYEKDVGCLIKKGEEKNIIQNVHIERNAYAPIEQGQKFGEITYSLNGNTLSTVNIVAKDKIDKISTLNMIVFVYNNWFNLSR